MLPSLLCIICDVESEEVWQKAQGVFNNILTQGGETPGRAGVTAALATGFAAAALTHAGSGDPTPG